MFNSQKQRHYHDINVLKGKNAILTVYKTWKIGKSHFGINY